MLVRGSLSDDIAAVPAKRCRRSEIPAFNFKVNCLFCGNFCEVKKDLKHPDRWKKNKGILCRTADRGKGKKSFKDVLLKVILFECDFRFTFCCTDICCVESRAFFQNANLKQFIVIRTA